MIYDIRTFYTVLFSLMHDRDNLNIVISNLNIAQFLKKYYNIMHGPFLEPQMYMNTVFLIFLLVSLIFD